MFFQIVFRTGRQYFFGNLFFSFLALSATIKIYLNLSMSIKQTSSPKMFMKIVLT